MSSIEGLRCDVLVVGGGPAGLAAAIALRLQGFQVAVADARTPPIDKACGEGILPAGLEALGRLGIEPNTSDGFRFSGIRFMEGEASVDFPFSSGCGMAIRRTRLHELLCDRAAGLGVQLLWGTTVPSISGLSRCQWIVGADGEHSQVRREAGLEGGETGSRRFGFRRHYRIAPWTQMVEVHWGAGYQIYVTPVSENEVGVALLCRDSRLRLSSELRNHPALEVRLRGAAVTSTERGASTTMRRLRRVFQGRTVLIGEASGSLDAIAGQGLSVSFLEAIALAESLASGNLTGYEAKHREISQRAAMTANLLLFLDRASWLRRLVWRGLKVQPFFLPRVLARYAAG